MTNGGSDLGKAYHDGEVIVRRGEVGECMFVIQSGRVEVVREDEGRELHLTDLGPGDVFGELALFEREVRSATVRAKGEVRVLTVDKRMFLKRIHQDPSLVFNLLQRMARRIRELTDEVSRLEGR